MLRRLMARWHRWLWLECLSAYVDDALSPRTKARVEEHLARCADCRREVEELRWVKGVLAQAPSVEVPASLVVRLEGARRGEWGWWVYRVLQGGVAVVALMLLLVVWQGWRAEYRAPARYQIAEERSGQLLAQEMSDEAVPAPSQTPVPMFGMTGTQRSGQMVGTAAVVTDTAERAVVAGVPTVEAPKEGTVEGGGAMVEGRGTPPPPPQEEARVWAWREVGGVLLGMLVLLGGGVVWLRRRIGPM